VQGERAAELSNLRIGSAEAEDSPLSPTPKSSQSARESVQVAFTLTGPEMPLVSRDAVLPEPETALPAVQLATVTGNAIPGWCRSS